MYVYVHVHIHVYVYVYVHDVYVYVLRWGGVIGEVGEGIEIGGNGLER